MVVWSVIWMIVILLIAYLCYLPGIALILLNMLMGLVETGPDVYQLQLLAETGEIVEYTVSKNDKNLSDLSY